MFTSNNKVFIYRSLIFVVVFLIILIGYFFLLNFYKNKILTKIKEIDNLKIEILQSQSQFEKARRLQIINNLIKQKTNKDLKVIIYELQQKLNRDFETTKNLILDKLAKENWQIQKTQFQENEKKINIVFLLSQNDYDKFSEFLFKEALVTQINELKINKLSPDEKSTTSLYVIDLTLQIK